MLFDIVEFLAGVGITTSNTALVFAISAVIYVYKDGKKERKDRQKIMDEQNDKWSFMYKENIDKNSDIKVALTELKGVIKNVYDLSMNKLKTK